MTHHHTPLEVYLDPQMDLDFDISPSTSSVSLDSMMGVYSWPSNSFSTVTAAPYTYNIPSLQGSIDYPKVNITGKGIEMSAESDIKLGDVSLKSVLLDLSERLAILAPDERLEAEYEELRAARAEYERVKDKLRMLEALKKTPVTEITG